ncbi:hypothetical protein L227DRAFT_191233 [Lentinus tigrinus ALCF2SS1-6]|uniref:Uncharacterized protein n=1 Tax=Lentinus tigrinus ALCF2SS1-6 TaxID=1328759 RepID=A0A5C2S5E7_9APHY|nr:hypothetical protein L227DRAFT_191233 [Lentinus tigrinus ALCF2SS1-6]
MSPGHNNVYGDYRSYGVLVFGQNLVSYRTVLTGQARHRRNGRLGGWTSVWAVKVGGLQPPRLTTPDHLTVCVDSYLGCRLSPRTRWYFRLSFSVPVRLLRSDIRFLELEVITTPVVSLRIAWELRGRVLLLRGRSCANEGTCTSTENAFRQDGNFRTSPANIGACECGSSGLPSVSGRVTRSAASRCLKL